MIDLTNAFHAVCPGCGEQVDVIPAEPLIPLTQHNYCVSELIQRHDGAKEEIRRLRDFIISARWRLAKNRPLWDWPCHECDAVLQEALVRPGFPEREESDFTAMRSDRDRLAVRLAKAEREAAWLRRLLQWCRMRFRVPGYQEMLDKWLAAGPSDTVIDGLKIVQSTDADWIMESDND